MKVLNLKSKENLSTLASLPRESYSSIKGGDGGASLAAGVALGIAVDAAWRLGESIAGAKNPKGPAERLFELGDKILNDPAWNPLNLIMWNPLDD